MFRGPTWRRSNVGVTKDEQERSSSRSVKSADRTLGILEALAASDNRLSLADLAKELDIPKSSLHALIGTLQDWGWVETDSSGRHFGLGVRALLVGTSYVDSDDIVAATRDALDWLSETVGETVHLGRLDGPDIVYLAKRESTHPLRLFSAIGRRLPAHATALGKVLLAQRTDAELDRILPEPLPRLSNNTITDRGVLRKELDRTRRRGWARDNQENATGIRCLAVTVGDDKPPLNAISCSVPVARLDSSREREIVDKLMRARQLVDRPRT
jgi:DNA-binding IclR family transcriptional regulator